MANKADESSKILHRVIRRVAGWGIWAFFSEVHVVGEENVRKGGPMIVVATHHNMMLDPAVLSTSFPHRRKLHYWAKASLFGTPIGKYVLTSSGVIPVDRKSKDNQVLFSATFQALTEGQVMAIFPEGTSYTEPRIMQVKDGASWVALEYGKWKKARGEAMDDDLVVVPAAIVYTNKSKYRSKVIVEFSEPIHASEFENEFSSETEGAPRNAVKKLTQKIENELFRLTVNAPDWDAMYAARMARDLLWGSEKNIHLDDFVAVSQTLVDLFSSTDAAPNFHSVRKRLLTYYSLLDTTHLTNAVLTSLPLPRDLNPRYPTPLPGRLRTVMLLIKDSFAVLIRLPFFLFPLIVHLPAYIVGRLGAKIVEDEEETQAQNKVVLGLLVSTLMVYPAIFLFIWAFCWYTPIGALISFFTVWLFAVYHIKIIDDNYEKAKRLIAAWRVLVGVWAPKKWDLSMSALSQYTTPRTPPENPWIDKAKKAMESAASVIKPSSSATPEPSTTESKGELLKPTTPSSDTTTTKRQRRPRPPSRVLIRHVLRARGEAAHALASFLQYLERTDNGEKKVHACAHLARLYGGFDGPQVIGPSGIAVDEQTTTGWRHAREVISFLRSKGACITTLEEHFDGDWAALSSEGEGDSSDVSISGTEKDDLVWVPSGVRQ